MIRTSTGAGRALALLAISIAMLLACAGMAAAQSAERIADYDVAIDIGEDGTLTIVETIAYDFGSAQRHGILRDIPTRLRYDDTYDRIYPLEVVRVRASGDTPAGYQEESVDGGITRIRVGDPDIEISGRHTYELTYRVEAALNGFRDHVELYWNAIGTEWSAPIGRADVQVRAPARITQVACFQGYEGSTLPCQRATSQGNRARFVQSGLGPFSGVTVVVGLPKGAVPRPEPVLEERWSLARAFQATPATVGVSAALGLAAVGGVVAMAWRRGRDRRFRGSQVDQVMGNPTGEQQAVPIGEAGASAPVEFAPPDDMRPGQMGTLIDEQANVLDVSATLVDLAVRGYLRIEELPKEGWFGKADWRLIRLEAPEDDLLTYERRLLNGVFRDGTEVTISELKNTFAERLKGVLESLYADSVERRWFSERPDKVRSRWVALGVSALVVAVGATVALAAFTHWGLLGIPLILGAVVLLASSGRMPARTAKGTAMLRRVRGFRTVIETAETHMARWAEKELVFTRFLPFAVVFGATEKWAKAFEALGIEPDTSWYVSPHPFAYASFARSMDGFAVTTGGTIASTPSGSGSSGFSGGGFSGGGGGGGGGGSW
ncbi:MAG TPA: DUF2207 domain-containing protein [Actinomycetota bacterium]|nr:DUF2207 domain-containing protein [Actinomycetota bacterium]